MKIKKIDTEVKNIALKTPFITALREVKTIEFVRVLILCDNGTFGVGEAPATKAITGEDIKTILDSIDKIKDKLIGCELDEALEVLHCSSIGSSAKASIDIAISSMLGHFKINNSLEIKTDITISLNSEEKMLKDAKTAFESGMNIFKIKLGEDITHATSVTKALKQKFARAKLLIDANQAWSLEKSLEYINAVKDLKIELIEQPVQATSLEELKFISNATSIPILADEAVFSLEDVKRVVESKSADMINIKLMKCGGFSKAMEILEYARKHGIKCMLGSMLEGPYSINAALYLAFNYLDVIEYFDLDSPLLYAKASKELDFKFDGCTISYKESLS